MKKLFVLLVFCLLSLLSPVMVNAATISQGKPQTLAITYGNIYVYSEKLRQQRIDIFNSLCTFMGTDMIDYERGQQIKEIYAADNHLQFTNVGLGRDDLVGMGKAAGADYVVYVSYDAHGGRPGHTFRVSPMSPVDFNIRIIKVATGENMLIDSYYANSKEFIESLQVLIDKAKTDIKNQNIKFIKSTKKA